MTIAYAPSPQAAHGVILRDGNPDDAAAAGEIIFRAFSTIAARHDFPPDFPDVEAGTGLASAFLSHPGFYSVLAEAEGRVIGSNFLDERTPIRGVGPLTIDPAAQNSGVGRVLMQDVLARAEETAAAGVRLVQASYHARSLALYASLGFAVREPLACITGDGAGIAVSGRTVRPATPDDLPAANELAEAVLGHDRSGDLADAVASGGASVVEHRGRVTGYTTGIAFFGHTVGEANDDVKALIAAASTFGGPGFLLPMRNAELFAWCLAHGLRVVQSMTLMTLGAYREPAGAYLPSILY